MQPLSLTAAGVRERLPTPDVARGFMLLLIALANIEGWASQASRDPARLSLADRVWLVLRVGLVDARAYPLFAFLFGFGLAMMSRHRPGQSPDDRHELVLTLRRRGWWLIGFGAVHSLIYPGDILGPYGVVAVMLAGAVVGRRWRVLTALAVVGALVSIGVGMPATPSVGFVEGFFAHAWWPLNSLGSWALGALATPFVSTVLPGVVLGMAAADRGWLVDTRRHRGRFGLGALAGIGLGFAASVPIGLHVAGFGPIGDTSLPAMLNGAGALLSAAGWVCLMAWLASWLPVAPDRSPVSGPLGVLAATGRRSLTVYLMQTLLFSVVAGLAFWSGRLDWFGPAEAALVAVAVWLVLALGCQALERHGEPGPFDHLLRVAVISSRGRRPLPPRRRRLTRSPGRAPQPPR